MFVKDPKKKEKKSKEVQDVSDLFEMFGGTIEKDLIVDLLTEHGGNKHKVARILCSLSGGTEDDFDESDLSLEQYSNSQSSTSSSASSSYLNTVLVGINRDPSQMYRLSIDLQKEYDMRKMQRELRSKNGNKGDDEEDANEDEDESASANLPTSSSLVTTEDARESARMWRRVADGEFSAMTAKFRTASLKYIEKKGKLGGAAEAGIISEDAALAHKPLIRYASGMAAMSVLKEKNPTIVIDVSKSGELFFQGFSSLTPYTPTSTSTSSSIDANIIITIDFHGLYVAEAQQFLTSVITFYETFGPYENPTRQGTKESKGMRNGCIIDQERVERKEEMTLRIVVGKGHRTPGGTSKLGPALLELVKNEFGYKVQLSEGVVVFRVAKKF